MISTFFKNVISLLEVFISTLGIFVLFLAETKPSIAILVNENGTNSPQIRTRLMKNISIDRTNLLRRYAGMLIAEKTDIDSSPAIKESHMEINEPKIEKNIPDIQIHSIENIEKIEGRHSEHYGKMLHSIVKKHQGEFPIHFICNKQENMSMHKNN